MLIYNEKQFASIGENFHDLTTVFSQEITYRYVMLNYLIINVKENISQSFIQTIGN